MSIGRRWLLPLVVAVIGALVVGVAWWVDQRDRVEVGIAEPADGVWNGESHNAFFRVPGGTVQVDVEVGVKTDDEQTRAPRGGSLVGVNFKGVADRNPGPQNLREEPETTRLWVRSGDRRFPISNDVPFERAKTSATTTDAEEPPDVLLAVSGSGRDLVVELEYAGRRQSVVAATGERVLGSFASLYRPGPRLGFSGPELIGQDARGGFEWSVDGRASWARRPYVAGLGWAKPGKEWLVLGPTSLRVSSISRPNAAPHEHDHRYEPDPSTGRGRATVEHARVVRKPATRLHVHSWGGAGYDPGGAVFEIDRGVKTALRLTVSVPVRSQNPEAPVRTGRVVATQTVPIAAVPDPGADR